MIESPSILLAFAAGVVSFVSPCCLPLVPGYLATVCGKPTGEKRVDPAVLARSLIFVTGFSLVFVMLGLGATALGSLLSKHQDVLRVVSGTAIALLGAIFVASAFVVRLNRDWRPVGLTKRAVEGGPLLAGVAFAFAWTPCVGPTLGAILGLASIGQSTAQGAGLLAVYSAGLGLPFILSAVAFGSMQSTFGWVRRHYLQIQVGSGLVLVGMGALVLSGELFRLNVEIQRGLDQVGLNLFQLI